MFDVHWYSLPIAVAALTSAALAIIAVSASRVRTRATKAFLMLNVGVMCWTASYLVELEMSPHPDIALAPIGSAFWWISLVKAVGLATTAVGWFMFAATQTRRFRLTRGPALWASIVFYAYTIAAITTNPLHGLYITQTVGGSADGPLRHAYLPVSWLFMLAGTWLLLSSLWRQTDERGRRRSIVLGVAVCVPLVGGIASNVLQVLGMPLEVNPAPVLFSVTTLVVAYDVFREGLADIAPISAARAFEAMADIAIVTDAHLVVLKANPAAMAKFPKAVQGASLEDVLPVAAAHARESLAAGCEYVPFELSLDGGTYWGRVYPTLSSAGVPLGSVVMLSDISDLRYAQEELARLLGRNGAAR